MESERAVVIVDLEKDQLAVCFKRSEIMFTVRIVLLAEIVVRCDGFYDLLYGLCAEAAMPGVKKASSRLLDRWRRKSSLRARMVSEDRDMLISTG